ncbi:putative transposase [Mesorhizobium albiziae]|uniref:Putative transposase n=1 Tax=Neomesorhizobium albiziae TaxID=335020 RepID=A0A1I4F4E0_9HYPH|nr:transposase [Mesorhizobium albiziae]GLS32456.1 transcriptional regulator [Mesorhizobium albiziae]SFL12140.1 putative transposase [Mesorhizobium albiziae]
MADLKETERSQASTEALAKEPTHETTHETRKKAPKPKRATGRATRTGAAKSGKQAPSSEAVAPLTVRTVRKIYSEKERAQKLGEIEKQTGRGDSIKDAIKKAGISEQTYYQWKKAAGQTPGGDELKDLVKLEEENVRLKKLLADRLRKENAELRKKLGLG